MKYYIRYLDDFVLLDSSKNELEIILALIDDFLSERLLLELHPEKTGIIPLHGGVNFLGFRCFYCHKLLKKSNIRYFLRTIQLKEPLEAQKSMQGWFAHAKHANTYKLCTKIAGKIQPN